MNAYLITLRLIHIGLGAFWVGAAITFAFFIQPTAAAVGPSGGAFIGHLVQQKRFPIIIMVTSLLSIIAGALLYWRTSNGFDPDWMSSGPGIGFTIGGLSAIVAWIIGFSILRPGMAKMAEMRAAGPEADMNEIERLGARLKVASHVNVTFVILAALLMSVARYLYETPS